LPKPDSSGYIVANGVNYWFEIHGKGEPLLLLPGGLFSTGMLQRRGGEAQELLANFGWA
jgi:hypothetical protein